MVNAITEQNQNSSLLNFVHHLPKPWSDRFIHVTRRTSAWTRPSFSSYSNRAPGGNAHDVLMHYSPYELMMNKWKKKYYRLANQTRKTRTFQRGVISRPWLHNNVMLQSSVAASFLFLPWALVTILGSKLILWGKKLWNNTLYEEEENLMVGIIMPGI